ncbi:MAG: PA0069 family radical SAM protein [Phycisphaera sp.]|nr:PA0069 family radical SAM protein [Phycisphaera sp.]
MSTGGGRQDHEYADALPQRAVRGRSTQTNPGNRYESVRLHVLGEYWDHRAAEGEQPQQTPTVVYTDKTKSILNRLDPDASPDIPFEWSLNPYRGCEHGCVYCYARPDHERLGLSCGLDFETKIVAKTEAPVLLRKELAGPKWQPMTIAMAGVTDVYQPIERELRITRGCLEVMAECRQPVAIVTKSRLVLRDLDLLTELARYRAVRVAVSLTTLDHDLSMKMEPRAASPKHRLETIRRLSEAGVPVVLMTAPIIPGLNDRELPALLRAGSDAGAKTAGYVFLRLPWQLKALFEDWLSREFPDRAGHVLSLLRQSHEGKLYDATPGVRQRGTGPIAEQVRDVFKLFTRKHHLDEKLPPMSGEHFRRPSLNGQMGLFADREMNGPASDI